LLPDLAAVHRAAHACPLARETLELAGARLAPLEALGDDPAPSADLLTARWAWREARAPSGDRPCVEAPAASVLPVAQTHAAALLTAPRPQESKRADRPAGQDQPVAQGRPAWPLWGVAGGSGVAAVGVAFIVEGLHKKDEAEKLTQMPNYNDSSRKNLEDSGRRYYYAGIGLAAGGAAVGVAALIYYFGSKGTPPATASVQVSGSPASMILTLAF